MEAGCGVLPFKYRDKCFVNALQWAIGLELFLLVNDPWRLFLTTDHPNGGPFTCYPHLIRLLMDKTFRQEMMRTINQDALKYSTLASLDREYTLYEIAIMTRAGPREASALRIAATSASALQPISPSMTTTRTAKPCSRRLNCCSRMAS